MFCDLAECEKDVSQVRIISKEIRRSSDGTHVIQGTKLERKRTETNQGTKLERKRTETKKKEKKRAKETDTWKKQE